ncbi:MAG TPA: alpha/beta hydrolase-fold protein [Thermoanaerobaculia bacterium]|nr:alpha/beta hydrolase-fold protein [Thermoanaerobaculia bacterium]
MTLLHTAHVPAGEGPFPTVLALHGWGASAHDLLGLSPLVHGGRALVLCPQGEAEVPIGGGAVGHGWFPLVPGQPPDPEAFRRALASIEQFVDTAAERYPVDPERLMVLGFSQGGLMAYGLALGRPERFAGLAALSSWFPAPLAEVLPPTEAHHDLPVLVVHGTRDTLVDVERARESRERLRPYGVRLMYRELDMAHEISREALTVILRWIDERALGAAAPG